MLYTVTSKSRGVKRPRVHDDENGTPTSQIETHDTSPLQNEIIPILKRMIHRLKYSHLIVCRLKHLQ